MDIIEKVTAKVAQVSTAVENFLLLQKARRDAGRIHHQIGPGRRGVFTDSKWIAKARTKAYAGNRNHVTMSSTKRGYFQ